MGLELAASCLAMTELLRNVLTAHDAFDGTHVELADQLQDEEGLRSAESAVLDIAEGVGRLTRADEARASSSRGTKGSRRSPRSKPHPSSGVADAAHVQRRLPIVQVQGREQVQGPARPVAARSAQSEDGSDPMRYTLLREARAAEGD